MLSLTSLNASDIVDLVYFICFDPAFQRRQLGTTTRDRTLLLEQALRVFVVITEPFEDRAIQTPPVRRAVTKYGYTQIAKQTLAYLKDPFLDLAGGPCSSLDNMGVLIRCLAQIDLVMARVFVEHGVHSAAIQRAWKVIRENISDDETFAAYHESLASIS